MGKAFELFSEADVRLIALALGPDYVVEAARYHGGGNPVLGAEAAYHEARGIVLGVIRSAYVRHRRTISEDRGARAGAKREVRGVLEALGHRGHFQRAEPIPSTPWRQLARACWPDGQAIDGWVEVVDVPADSRRLLRAVIRATSRLLDSAPELNRALLRDQLCQRQTSEVMVHIEIWPDEIRPVILDASDLDDAGAQAALRRALRGLLRAKRHRLAPLGDQLLQRWVEAGFIASPAGAMISPVGDLGIERALPVLIPANGVPIAIAIGELYPLPCPEGCGATLGITLDHRVLDASHGGLIHRYLREEVPRLCRDE